MASPNIEQLIADLKLAYTDELTGLFRRGKLDTILKNQPDPENNTYLIIDIDYFGAINNRYGHDVGDLALKAVTGLLKSCVDDLSREKSYAIPGSPADIITDTNDIYRWGGEEFLIRLYKMPYQDATAFAEHLRKKVEEEIGYLTISIGVAQHEAHENSTAIKDFAYAFKKADDRLYIAKRKGRNQVVADWTDPQLSFGFMTKDAAQIAA
ncbi:MAG: GGDEF domain-containing protein [Nanoarchaeota archaeon]